MADSRLFDLAKTILTEVADAYVAAGLAPPNRRYVSHGPPADDCEQLTTRYVRLFNGTPGNEVGSPELCGGARTAVYEIRVARCVSTGEGGSPASAAALENDARVLLLDAGVIFYELLRRYHTGEFLSNCQGVRFDGPTPFGPQGGIGAYLTNLQVQVQ